MNSRHSLLIGVGAVGVLAILVASSCSRGPGANDAVKAELERSGKQKSDVAPLAGRILVDGQPLESKNGKKTVVMLFDAGNTTEGPNDRPNVTANDHGEFAFSQYTARDGYKPGKYVVVIAQLEKSGKAGLKGPDGLKNLYNDPDKNAKDPQFVIDHKPPGKSDYVFDLKINGVDPVPQPAPRALKDLLSGR